MSGVGARCACRAGPNRTPPRQRNRTVGRRVASGRPNTQHQQPNYSNTELPGESENTKTRNTRTARRPSALRAAERGKSRGATGRADRRPGGDPSPATEVSSAALSRSRRDSASRAVKAARILQVRSQDGEHWQLMIGPRRGGQLVPGALPTRVTECRQVAAGDGIAPDSCRPAAA